MSQRLATSDNFESVELTGNVGTLSLTGNFKELSLPGIKISQTHSGLVVVTNQPVQVQVPANGNGPTKAFATTLEVGRSWSSDKWLYVGQSPENGKNMWLEPGDYAAAPYAYVMSWARSRDRLARLGKKQGAEIRQPTPREQTQIYADVISKGLGGFKTQASYPAETWWSSEANGHGGAWMLLLATGRRGSYDRSAHAVSRGLRFSAPEA